MSTTVENKGPTDAQVLAEVAKTPETFWNPEYWRKLREEFGVPDFKPADYIDVEHWLQKIPIERIGMNPRGRKVSLETGGIPEKIPRYLRMLIFLTGGPMGPLGLQFIAQPDKERQLTKIAEFGDYTGFEDSLNEDDAEVSPGLIHKYQDRVLLLTTEQCAAYCRYCTRSRRVGVGKALEVDRINLAFDYIERNPQIREIILSGGDSFVIPEENFNAIVDRIVKIQANGGLESVRWGTRSIIHNAMPGEEPKEEGEIQQPGQVLRQYHLDGLRRIKNPNVMLHINNAAEITTQVMHLLTALQEVGATFHSQSVLLQGVNDDRQTLVDLFKKIQASGIHPYYMYMPDEVAWSAHMMVTVPKAKQLFYRIKNDMGGLASAAEPVIDVPDHGEGKIGLFSSYWIDSRHFQDYDGKNYFINDFGLVVVHDPEKHGPFPETNMWESGMGETQSASTSVTVFDGSPLT